MSPGSTSRSRPTISWILLILANVLWACSYVAAKYVLRDISANMMNALRMMIAALVLLPLLIALRKETEPDPSRPSAACIAGNYRHCHG